MGFKTDAIHAGQIPDPTTGAVSTPIYQTSTYAQEALGQNKGFTYGRTHNFTRQALEKNIAALEKGKHGVAFSSGLASVQAILGLVKSGDHLIVSHNVYGGVYRMMELIMKDFGLEFSWVDTADVSNIEKAIKKNTKIVYIETPTNPMLNLTDIEATSKICRSHNLILVVDNTFMTPYFQNPLLIGADVVLHSTTKYLNGHCDVVGGILITNSDKLHERFRYLQNSFGAIPSPFDCWLTLRSTKTLALRMEQHNSNAIEIARYLAGKTYAKRVIYPGLTDHPQHKLAVKQARGFGGMISVDFGDFRIAEKVLNNVKIFALAESLGGVESLICHPATMTHGAVPKEEREKFGLTDSLVRFSIGIEDVEDLIADIEQALK